MFAAAALFTGTWCQGQELTDQQQQDLMSISTDYAQKAAEYEEKLDAKVKELTQELRREGRLDTEKSAKKGSEKVNELLTEIAAIYGDSIKTQVSYVLDAKNVLTMEQRFMLLERLQYEEMTGGEMEILEVDIIELPINLSLEQEKKLLMLDAEMEIEAIKLERDVQLVLLDLEVALMGETIDTKQVDKQIMKLADLAVRAINIRVDHFIGSKDVLTLDQKRLMSLLLGL
jgi:Spy/CpxP family protein refolding chaperone